MMTGISEGGFLRNGIAFSGVLWYNNSSIGCENDEGIIKMDKKREGYYGSTYGNHSEEFYNIDDSFTVDIGYGEEPSYIFYLKKNGIVQKGIDIWEGYIDTIINLIPTEGGKFTGLTYYYNVGEFNDDYWHIDDMDLIFRQLKSVDIFALQDKGKDYIAAYTALLKFMEEMLDSNNEIDVMKL